MSESLLPPNRRIANPFGRSADGSAASGFWSFVLLVIAGAAVVGLILGAICMARTTVTVVTDTTNGAITNANVQFLGGTGARAMTLGAADLATMVGKTITIISSTAAAHTVTLSGGAHWTAAGTETIATWPAHANIALQFYVVSSTALSVLSNADTVVFS